jgi:DNA ligase (NAD+)
MIGARVLVRRSNEVIPEILGTTEIYENSKPVEKPKSCPYCNSPLEEVGANLFCPNKECRPRVIAKLTNFACKNGVDVEGFSEKTAGLLYDEFKVEKFSDLYALKREDVRKLEGYKDAKTDNLFDALEKSKKVSLPKFIYALGIDNVGKKTAVDLAEKYKTIQNLSLATKESLLEVEDVGEVVADCIVRYFLDSENVEEIKKLFDCGFIVEEVLENKVDGVFSGEKVVLTGTLIEFKRDDAAKIIENLGGEIQSSVSKKTTLVIAGESAGSKLEKARALNIKIIDEETFKLLIKT